MSRVPKTVCRPKNYPMMQLIYKLAVSALFVLAALLITSIALAANPFDSPTAHLLKINEKTTFSSLMMVNLAEKEQALTTVSFVQSIDAINEHAGTYSLCLTIGNPDTLQATTAEIALITGNPTKIGDYSTQTITFPANSTTDECLTLTITDNNYCQGNQSVTFEIQNVAGGTAAMVGTNATSDLTIVDNELEMIDLAAQGFEGTTADDWVVTSTPSTYNVDEDVWGLVNALDTINPSSCNLFWGMQDLNNLNGGGAFDHVLDFEIVDVTGAEGAIISFDYNVIEFDTGDNFKYEIYLDGAGQGEILLVEGNDTIPVSTNGWITETIPIPTGTMNVALQIRVLQNGEDQAGIDNFSVKMPGCLCLADAGDIATITPTANFSICEGENLLDDAMNSAVFTANFEAIDETNAGEGYDYAFILVENATGTIFENNTSGSFDFSTKDIGGYTVYGLSYWVENTADSISNYLNGITGDADLDDVAQIQNDEISDAFCLNFDALMANGLPATVQIFENIDIALANTDPTTCDGTDGTITIRSLTPNVFYDISYTINGNTTGPDTLAADADGEIILTNLPEGNYSILVESNGCSDTDFIILNEPATPTYAIFAENTPLACGGLGSIILNELAINTTYEVTIDNGISIENSSETSNTLGEITFALPAGNYSIVLTLNNCNGAEILAALADPITPTAIATPANPVCANSNTGAIDLTVSDGTGSYSYEWTTPDGIGLSQTEEDQTNLSEGTYKVVVTDDVTTCTTTLTMILVGDDFAAPDAFDAIEICEGESIILIPEDGGQPNTNPPTYNYYDANPANGGLLLATGLEYEVPVPAIVPIDGLPYLIFVTVADDAANCESVESTEVSITIFPKPTANPIPANAGICLGSSKNFNSNPMTGTAPFFYNWEITGGTATGVVLENSTNQIVSVNTENATEGFVEITYLLGDLHGCVSDLMVMNIEIGECDAMIADPCACLNNATTTENGQFLEEVEITGPAGQMWTVVAVNGLFQTNSTAPPAAPIPIATGAVFTEVSPGIYHLEGIHVDANGYSLTAEEAGGQQLTISNTCFYSDPMITGLDGPICLFTAPFSSTFEANGVDGMASFTINGNPETEVNPMQLGIGTHTVELTFEAGDALGYLLVDGVVEGAPDFAETLLEAMANPGCEQSVSMTFEIEETPTQITCNNQINFSLDQNCEVFILSDMILEGDYNCYDDYGVTIKRNNLFDVPNPITGDYIGDNLTVTITHLPSGNSCWSTVTVADYLPPFFANCPDVTVECYENPDDVSLPNAEDNCTGNPFVFMIDEVTDTTVECDGVEIVQTFVATDFHNNISVNCTRTIFIPTPGLPDLAGDATWTCDEYAQFPMIMDATPLTGNLTTTGSGVPIKIDGTYCNYDYTHSDDTLSSCGNTFKIIRTWTILNWCTGQLVFVGGNGEDNVQVIAVWDETPAVISAEPVTVSASINGQHPQPCRSTGFIPPATVTDNCNDFTVKIFTSIGEVNYANGVDGEFGGTIPLPGLTLGDHIITYSVQDICGNFSGFDVVLTVIDDVTPIAICDFITTVNLTNDGTAIVFAETFDDGSYDNCCLEDFAVRRPTDNCGVTGNTSFSETVTFCCEDIAASPIIVFFQVADCFGNTNECSVQVNVDDQLAPSIVTCPAPQSMTCDTYNLEYEPALLSCGEIQSGMSDAERLVIFNCRNSVLNSDFSAPLFYDNCAFEISPTVVINLDQCDAGNITRTWRAKDGQGQFSPVCSQTIAINHVSDFEVAFPPNYEVNDCISLDDFEPENLPSPFNEPAIFFETCELIAKSHDDQIFTIVNDACYKIVRTWTVINWCTVGDQTANEIADPFINGRYRDGGDGYIQRQQQILINDTVAPILTCETEIPVCIIENCAVDVTIPTPNAEDCSDDITFVANGDLGIGFAFQNVGVGSYEMTITATDNCGNTSACNTTVIVTDCKLPMPYCKDGIIIEIMNTQPPMVSIWAEDLNDNSIDNCGLPTNPFGIELLGAGGAVIAGSPTTQSIDFDCDMIGAQLVKIWVTDIYGLQDFCTTFVIIQDNMNNCPNNIVIGGLVETVDNEGVNEVEIFVSGEMSSETMTDVTGSYVFDDLLAGGDYSVIPQKDIDPRNGVSTLDLLYIQKHVLNIELLASPYQMIAADANNSKSITTLDMVEIQKLILLTIPTFQNNTSWRFVAQDYEFPNPANPWQEFFPDIKNYNNLPEDEMNANFFGIKIGDLNGSVNPANLLGADDRNFTDELTFTTKNQQLEVGKEYSIEFTSDEISEIVGYQFTLNFDPTQLEFLEVKETKITSADNFGFTFLEEGALTASWHRSEEIELAENEVLIHLKFRASVDGELSNFLQLNSRYTAAEAYPKFGIFEGIWSVDLDFVENGHIFATQEMNLYQNHPNPFANRTLIGFDLPKAGRVTLTIYDLTGNVRYVVADNFAAGYQEIEVQKADLGASGVLIYRIETDTDSAVKKMMIE
ncbi:MAG: hypothetical protein ACI9XO_003500 [Paraglaciecola sp.]